MENLNILPISLARIIIKNLTVDALDICKIPCYPITLLLEMRSVKSLAFKSC